MIEDPRTPPAVMSRAHPRARAGRNDFADLQRLWQIDSALLDRLKACRPVTERALRQLDGTLYRTLFGAQPIRLLTRHEATRRPAVGTMIKHWRALLSGVLSHDTLLEAALIGRRLQELDVTEHQLLALSQRVLDVLIDAVIAAGNPEPARAIEAIVRIVRFGSAITRDALADGGTSFTPRPAVQTSRRAIPRLREEVAARERLTYVDALTGLLNRRYFNQALAAAIADAMSHGEPLCLIMANIDHFKQVNDRHGHLAGDRVLQALAGAMADAIRADDLLSRFGGEEFAVILPSTSMDQTILCAERLRAAAEASPVACGNGGSIHVTLSLGVAMFWNRERADHLVQAADMALREAKRRGRNQVAVRPDEDARSFGA